MAILDGAEEIASQLGLDRLLAEKPFCAFDELHKYRHWRDFLKGFFDVYENRVHVLVTGSAHLNVFKRAGDSLMGRYFPYTLHPLSVAECAGRGAPDRWCNPPVASMKTGGRRYGATGVSPNRS